MVAKFQNRIQRYGWNKAAPIYDELWGRQLAPAHELLIEMAAPRAGERVLDVACGTGVITFRAAEAVASGGTVVGVDISDEMVKRCRAEARRRGIGRIGFERAKADGLDYPDGTFTSVLCSLGLMYVPDPGVALREFLRVLRPGGQTVVAVWGARKNCGWAGIFPAVDARVRSEVCPLFFQLGTGGALRMALETAGFEEVEVRRICTALRYDSAREAVAAAFAAGPVALAYSRFDDLARMQAHAEYLASIEPYRRGGGYDLPGEFVLARGVKPFR